MPSCIRTVDFTVTEKDISPSVPQWAGVQGEHQATRVRFQLPTSLTGDGFVYRVEWVDGMQSFGTSGALAASEDGKVSFLLPASWTAAGGTAEVRLCVCKDETDAANGQVFCFCSFKTWNDSWLIVCSIRQASSSAIAVSTPAPARCFAKN